MMNYRIVKSPVEPVFGRKCFFLSYPHMKLIFILMFIIKNLVTMVIYQTDYYSGVRSCLSVKSDQWFGRNMHAKLNGIKYSTFIVDTTNNVSVVNDTIKTILKQW